MQDDAYKLLAGAIMGFALLMAAYALFSDWIRLRIKKRRRCPKCRYDMSHTIGMRCSECGYQARREKQLFRAIIRRWLIAAAVLLLIGAHFVRSVPGMRERGWPAAVPTTMLIASLPWVEPERDERWQFPVKRSQTLSTSSNWSASSLLLSELLHERIRQKRIFGWQARLLAEVLLREIRSNGGKGDPDQSAYKMLTNWAVAADVFGPSSLSRLSEVSKITIVTRPAWPASMPVFGRLQMNVFPEATTIQMRLRSGAPGAPDQVFDTYDGITCALYERWPWSDGLVPVGVLAPEHSSLECQLILEYHRERKKDGGPAAEFEFQRNTLQVPVQAVASVQEVLTGVKAEELSEVIQRSLRPKLTISTSGCYIDIPVDNEAVGAALWRSAPLTLAVRFDVLADAAIVASSVAWWAVDPRWESSDFFVDPGGTVIVLDIPQQVLDAKQLRAAKWTVRLRSDPEIALRNFNSDRYWDGEVTLPLEVNFD